MTDKTTEAVEGALQTAYAAINAAEDLSARDQSKVMPHLLVAVRWLAESVNALVQMEKRRG